MIGAMPEPPAMKTISRSLSRRRKSPYGPLTVTLSPDFQVLEHLGGADAVGHEADLQLDLVLARRLGGDGVGAVDRLVGQLVGGHLELDVLAGVEIDGRRVQRRRRTSLMSWVRSRIEATGPGTA